MSLLHAVHVPAGPGPFPTILALHGWGASAHDLFGLAPLLHGGNALVIAPQGPIEVPIGPGINGYGWFPITAGSPPDPAEFATAAKQLAEFLDFALDRYPVDPRKLIVMGFSQGGVMAYDMVLRDAKRFAGLVALSSWLPESMAQSIPKSDALENFPVLVMHGTQDPMIDVERARESRAALLELNVNLAYHEFEMGHEITPDGLRELLRWLEEKVISPIQLV